MQMVFSFWVCVKYVQTESMHNLQNNVLYCRYDVLMDFLVSHNMPKNIAESLCVLFLTFYVTYNNT